MLYICLYSIDVNKTQKRMNIEAKKLSLIERFMKLKEKQSILKLEAAITEIELNTRADASREDIEKGETRSYDDFSKEVKQWLKNKSGKSS